jgi:hypothetical protein
MIRYTVTFTTSNAHAHIRHTKNKQTNKFSIDYKKSKFHTVYVNRRLFKVCTYTTVQNKIHLLHSTRN